MKERYSIKINWSEENNCYIAIVPELSGCSALGDNYKDALRNLEVAKKLYLEVCKSDNLPLPKPIYI